MSVLNNDKVLFLLQVFIPGLKYDNTTVEKRLLIRMKPINLKYTSNTEVICLVFDEWGERGVRFRLVNSVCIQPAMAVLKTEEAFVDHVLDKLVRFKRNRRPSAS